MSKRDELPRLRDEIAEVDRDLLDLLQRRMELAAEVGRAKAVIAAPIVVRDVEDRVYSRAREYAEACGVSAEVMEAIFSAIVRGSVERQHRVGVEMRARRGGRVLILGGAGGMGAWFTNFLTLLGHSVHAVDPAFAAQRRRRGRSLRLADVADIDAFDAILVAVPLAATPDVLDDVVGRVPRGVVVEIASIKDHLASTLARARSRGVTVSCLHPMFGPSKSPYSPLTFVLACQEDEEAERQRLEGLLRHPYTNVVAIQFPHHDLLMGWLLGLAHLTGIVFGTALRRSGLDPRQLQECASTTFHRQAATALSVLSEDPDLYLDIQRLNPHREEIYGAARAALESLARMVENADRDQFRLELAAARLALESTPPSD
jgi:chorismate mutase/prephenate dehydrogenase